DLPPAALPRVRHMPEVESASSVAQVSDATVRRSSYVPEEITGGISVPAADADLLATLQSGLRDGRSPSRASGPYPAVVLGARAAERLGIRRLDGIVQVYIAGRLFTVIGILEP